MNVRTDIKEINEIPNIGPAMTRDLALLNIFTPSELIGKDPYKMYDKLCQTTGTKHDPCVIDIFISAVRFMEGEPSRKWWYYTSERKTKLSQERSRK
ncbi:MAG: helix-hairpin-helix domain-containing protein [Proteobacteria bacterium]|nr:mitomycin resistance protein [Desulfobulbaceae bacterium]MBU4152304.1 helix-hairpin-helix domain-containing protein [Pseudomonadota bacterium]